MTLLKYIFVGVNFFILIFSAKKNVKPKDPINKRFAMLIIFGGLVASLLSCYFVLQDEKEHKTTKKANVELREKLDSLTKISNIQTGQIDTQIQVVRYIQEEIEQSKPLDVETLDFQPKSKFLISGTLEQGTTLEIIDANCLTSVVLVHNGDDLPIRIDNSGSGKISIPETGNANSSYLYNRGRAHCTMTVKILPPDYSNIKNNEVKINVSTTDINVKEHDVCIIDEVDFSGEWILIEEYDECSDNSYDNTLNVHFKIEKIVQNEAGYYEVIGYKFGEDYRNSGFSEYKNKPRLHLKNGKLNDQMINPNLGKCKLVLPIGNNDGIISFDTVEYIDDAIFLTGTFQNNAYKCSGTVTLMKIE